MGRDLKIRTEKVAKSFWSKITKGDGCWQWVGGRVGANMSSFYINGKRAVASRVMWENYVSHIPDKGKTARVFHRCGNTLCMNPEHLFLGIDNEFCGSLEFHTERAKNRFWKSVKKGPNCWEWLGVMDSSGYGMIMINRENRKATRIMYANYIGPIPGGLQVCHRCDNRSCVNPAHLFLGTPKDNMQDCVKKGRHNKPKGSRCHLAKLTEDDVVIIKQHLSDGKLTHIQIGVLFGVTGTNIRFIATGRTWKHLG